MQSKRRLLGMTITQLAIVAGAGLLYLCLGCGGFSFLTIQLMTSEPLAPLATVAPTNPLPTFTPTLSPEEKLTAAPPTETPSPAPTATREPGRHYEPAGGYSFIPPAGWQMVELAGLKYKVAITEVAGFNASINFVDELYDGTLNAYISANRAVLQQAYPDVTFGVQEEFFAAANIPAARLQATLTIDNRKLRHIYYFFDSGQRNYIATCSLLADGSQDFLIEACNQSLRTFRIEPQP
ncbi:MAG: alanine and proline-rich secreted protein Apa [Anaerolineales bacterium]|nr:alanine and proline-rich secreted protein Apa [Anaerolineales bacterium]